MKIVIPYRNDGQSGEELKFAIRSLVKHFTPMSGLILVGDLPKWYKGDHLFMNDIISKVDFNIYRKLIAGAKGETVLFTNDDIFALKPFDETLPNYACDTCGNMAKDHTSGRHRRQYLNCDPNWYNFDIHCPMIIDTSKYPPMLKDMPVKTAYAGPNNLPATPLMDLKFGNGNPYEKIKEKIEGKPFFSTSPFSMNKGMIDVLHELYPQKSNWEK